MYRILRRLHTVSGSLSLRVRYVLAVSVIALVLLIAFIRLVSEFSTANAGLERQITFHHDGDRLTGTLLLPKNTFAPPLAVLVHGDGPQDRWSDSGYLPLVNDLLSRGIAVYSWDKPGTGKSSGNWLAQTMRSRAEEAAEAVKALKQEPELRGSRVGFIGFSQAGWVVPQASQLVNTDFIVLIGPAVNWRNQSLYYTEQRLGLQGVSHDDILRQTRTEARVFDQQFTYTTAALPCKAVCDREDFERRNALADAQRDIARIRAPVMIVMGEDDRNVNPHETVAIYNRELPAETPRIVKLVPHATHGMLRSEWFDYQLPGQWPVWKQALFIALGHHAYQSGVLDSVASWIVTDSARRSPF